MLLSAGCTLPGPTLVPTYTEQILTTTPSVLIIDAHYAPGYEPSEAAKTHLVETLRNVTAKTKIEWQAKSTPRLAEPSRPWNITRDLAPIANELSMPRSDAAILVVLYPAGKDQNPDAAGISLAPGGPSVVYLDALRENPSPTQLLPLPRGSIEPLERATLLHEVGHAIGLVNAGLPMQRPHEDAQHDAHSSSADSVMYWALDSTRALRDILLRDESLPATFDANDLADLTAGKERTPE